jgi:hypothetical protein
MKKLLLPVIPLAAILASSCQQNSTAVETLPPVVEKRPAEVKPKKRTTRSYKKPSKPKKESTATTIAKKEEINPLAADPVKINPIDEIPRFEVPENVQPKVSDGINQAEFIELKW